ncbi:MAG: penicillin acylase family protein [Natrialbaceae archaeon]|nr:penicillin acylase family protein [Natrialbaceae archaeon]
MVRTARANTGGVGSWLHLPRCPLRDHRSKRPRVLGIHERGVDVVDLYTYEFDAYNERYRYRGEWEEIETRTEEVEVADGENRSVEVRKTVHGPLIEREDEQIGVAWTGFTASRTVEAVHGFAHSENADEFLDSLEDFDLPPQSLVYADDEEAIYHLTGKLPIRRTPDGEAVPGNTVFDGSEPEAEWEGYTPFGESSWDGFIPFDEKPHVHDADYIATANQRIADDPSYYLGTSYMGPERGKRIYDVLDEAAANDDPMDIPFHEDLQTDVRDERAARVVDDIVAAVEAEGGSGATADAADLLAGWDYRMVRDSEAALIFAIWMDHFATEVVTDQYEEAGLDVSKPIDWVVLNLPPDSGFFENRSRDATIVAALEAALSEIDEAGWSTYGDWNTTRGVTHPFGQQVPFLNYPVLPADGSRGTVNNFRVEQPGQDFAAGTSLRMIDQPGGGSSAILPGGNSGDYFSDHYQDQFDEFLAGEYRSMDRSIDGDLVTTFEEEA